MKKTITVLCLLLGINSIAQEAEDKSDHTTHFFIHAAADYYMKNPVENINTGSSGLSAQPNIGAGLGGVFLLQRRNGMFLNTGLTLRYAPRTIDLTYNAVDMGYTGSNYTTQQTYYYDKFLTTVHIKLGYSFLPKYKNKLDVSCGFNFNIPVNGFSDRGITVHENVTSTTKTDLLYFQQYKWGTQTRENFFGSMFYNIQYSISASYRLNNIWRNGKSIRLGIDVNRHIRIGDEPNINLYFYDPNRKEIARSSYQDFNNAMSLFIDFEL